MFAQTLKHWQTAAVLWVSSIIHGFQLLITQFSHTAHFVNDPIQYGIMWMQVL